MKIGLFTELFPPNMGGQEIRFQQIAQGLARRGHDVHVFCVAHLRELSAHEWVDGYQVHRHPVATKYEQPFIKALRRSPVAVLRYALWTRRVLATGGFNFTLMNQWPYLHILTAPHRARERMVVDWCEAREGAVYTMAQRYLPRLGRTNIAVSPGVAREIGRASGREPLYLPSGIHVSEYTAKSSAERRGLLSLGRLVQHKNFPLLIEAFEAAVANGYSHDLLVAGSGPAEAALRACVAASPLRARIHLLGRVDEARKRELLANADLLVITSRREGFPRVIAEAMASGLPTVTVDFAENASADVIRRYGVGRISAPTPSAVADAIAESLREREALGARCIEEAKSLDWAHLLPMLEELADQGKTPRRN